MIVSVVFLKHDLSENECDDDEKKKKMAILQSYARLIRDSMRRNDTDEKNSLNEMFTSAKAAYLFVKQLFSCCAVVIKSSDRNRLDNGRGKESVQQS